MKTESIKDYIGLTVNYTIYLSKIVVKKQCNVFQSFIVDFYKAHFAKVLIMLFTLYNIDIFLQTTWALTMASLIGLGSCDVMGNI